MNIPPTPQQIAMACNADHSQHLAWVNEYRRAVYIESGHPTISFDSQMRAISHA